MAAREIWIVGDWPHEDFAPPLLWLRQHTACCFYATVNAAIAASRDRGKSSDPDAVLLVQSRPGQISRPQVERLYAHLPLTRLIGLAGPWCEGELRTGRPWPGVVRVPWRDWRWRLPRELGLNGTSRLLSDGLPRTATETDRLQQSVASLTGLRFIGNVKLVTPSRATFEAWSAALQRLGVRCLDLPAGSHAASSPTDLQIIDGWDNVARAAEPADSPSTSAAQSRILLLHFPRPDDIIRAASLGIAAVLAQPLLLADLAAALQGALRRSSIAPRESAA
jgi:hypothetical protein